jgi:hypothetical protein
MTTAAVFEAKCATCGEVFGLPSLGDMSYGSAILTSVDGQAHLVADAFSDFPQRLKKLLGDSSAKAFWSNLALLADAVNGKSLACSQVCPRCQSTRLEYWDGSRLGEVKLAGATFLAASELSDVEIRQHISPARCDGGV